MKNSMPQSVNTPGTIVDARPDAAAAGTQHTDTLLRTSRLEVIRVMVPAGSTVPTHEAQGEVVLHCLSGRVGLVFREDVTELRAGQLLYLRVNEPFAVRGMEDSCVLLTIVLPMRGHHVPLIG